jgi:hypothetical protein
MKNWFELIVENIEVIKFGLVLKNLCSMYEVLGSILDSIVKKNS